MTMNVRIFFFQYCSSPPLLEPEPPKSKWRYVELEPLPFHLSAAGVILIALEPSHWLQPPTIQKFLLLTIQTSKLN